MLAFYDINYTCLPSMGESISQSAKEVLSPRKAIEVRVSATLQLGAELRTEPSASVVQICSGFGYIKKVSLD